MKSIMLELGYTHVETNILEYKFVKSIYVGDREIYIIVYDTNIMDEYTIMVYEERDYNYSILCNELCNISILEIRLIELESYILDTLR